MKIKIVLTGLILVSFLACTSEKKMDSNIAVQAEREHGHLSEGEDHKIGLSLNNGSRWQTDESTWVHAVSLNALVEAFNKKEHTDIEAYRVFGTAMQNELGGLVKDCKMKGADHDALHLWLEPVMKDVNDLNKAGTADEGSNIVATLTADVEKFNLYFENAH